MSAVVCSASGVLLAPEGIGFAEVGLLLDDTVHPG